MNDISVFEFLTSFFSGCASFFELQIPFLPNVTFFQVFAGFMILKVLIAAVHIIFGIHSGSGEEKS